jgi:hypothetical protein
MPIQPSIGHVFFAWDLDKLLSFIKKNPQYHIISECKAHTCNRFIPDAAAWYMGDGDPDPEITNVVTPQYWQKVADAWRASKPRSYAKLR